MWPPPPPPAGTWGTRGRILALTPPSARPSPPPPSPASPPPSSPENSNPATGEEAAASSGRPGGRSGLLPRPRPGRLARRRAWVCVAPTGSTGRAVPARKPEPARREGRARGSRALGPPRGRQPRAGRRCGAFPGPPTPRFPCGRRCPSRPAPPPAPPPAESRPDPGHRAAARLVRALVRAAQRGKVVTLAIWDLEPSTPPSDNPFAGKWFYSGTRNWGWGCRPG